MTRWLKNVALALVLLACVVLIAFVQWDEIPHEVHEGSRGQKDSSSFGLTPSRNFITKRRVRFRRTQKRRLSINKPLATDEKPSPFARSPPVPHTPDPPPPPAPPPTQMALQKVKPKLQSPASPPMRRSDTLPLKNTAAKGGPVRSGSMCRRRQCTQQDQS
ncbi:hypothetical protein DFS34DRAFT_599848 [Phlyctochytrium arcticum]|nr:hypothetical protein DFS34DRAFT_599848 [Phlyctochytrium arcticum]